MGIKRLLIDSRIHGGWTVWYSHTKIGPDRRRDREDWAARGHARGCWVSVQCSGLMTDAAVSALGGHSNDSMGGPSTPLM